MRKLTTMDEPVYHIPALLRESVKGLAIKPGGVYADVTFGGGGHSRAILAEMDSEARLYGFDRDGDAMRNVPDDNRFTFIRGNFRYLRNFMRYHNEDYLDGIIADLGVSFHHFDSAERGFSFRENAPLDMRMNRDSSLTAADIVNDYDEERLTGMIRLYTDLKPASRWARAIVKSRTVSPIDTTFRLVEAVKSCVNPRQEKKELAQIFQALRIETNHEMDDLRIFLESTVKTLRPGGRLAVLTYHSIEDRMVKNFLRSGNIEGKVESDLFGRISTPWKLITRSPITADDEEIERNPRSRSAKLRIAEYQPE